MGGVDSTTNRTSAPLLGPVFVPLNPRRPPRTPTPLPFVDKRDLLQVQAGRLAWIPLPLDNDVGPSPVYRLTPLLQRLARLLPFLGECPGVPRIAYEVVRFALDVVEDNADLMLPGLFCRLGLHAAAVFN